MLRIIESFDHTTNNTDLGTKWSSVGAGIQLNGANTGRRNTYGMYAAGFVASSNIKKTLDNQATWIIGFAFKSVPTSNIGDYILCSFLDSTTHQVLLYHNYGSSLGLSLRNGSGTVLGTSTQPIPTNVWNYIEIKVNIHDTTGSYEVRVNNGTWISGSNANTRNSSNNYANIIQLGMHSSAPPSGGIYYDDVYICDATGATNNDFLGDIRVDCVFPNGNGNYSQFTGSDSNSTDNYLNVMEITADSDTSYNQSSTLNQIDTYTIGNISHTPTTIFGVQSNIVLKKDDSGARSAARVIRSNGSDYVGSNYALSTSYTYLTEIHETNPNTGVAWTQSNFNSAEFGVKVAV